MQAGRRSSCGVAACGRGCTPAWCEMGKSQAEGETASCCVHLGRLLTLDSAIDPTDVKGPVLQHQSLPQSPGDLAMTPPTPLTKHRDNRQRIFAPFHDAVLSSLRHSTVLAPVNPSGGSPTDTRHRDIAPQPPPAAVLRGSNCSCCRCGQSLVAAALLPLSTQPYALTRRRGLSLLAGFGRLHSENARGITRRLL